VKPLIESQIAATATLLGRAMDEDPAYRYLFPDGAVRPRGLTDFFERNLRTHLPFACTHVLVEGSEVVGTVTMRPPGGIHISTLTMIRRGLLPFALAHGRSAVRRLFALKEAYDRLESDLARGGSHWHVHMMAVDPSRQGRGLGTGLLRSVLETTRDSPAAHPIVLTTHQQRNVVFYARAGFTVVDERELTLPGAAPYRVWGMESRA
jgi:GNAT superfamily N-acetyltransferase